MGWDQSHSYYTEWVLLRNRHSVFKWKECWLDAPPPFFKNLFIYLFLVLVAACRLSLVGASRGYSSLRCAGFLLRWLLLVWSMGSRPTGFSSCGTWAQQLWLTGSRAQAQQLWLMGLAAPQHVGSSWTRTRTRVPCIGRQILNHCTTREVLPCHFFFKVSTLNFFQV